MYNRYIPAEDGTFRRQSLPETEKAPAISPPCPQRPPESLPGFFTHLLPQGLDAEDLIVVLLLLLMSENCRDTPNTALITLLIYLFL